MNLLTETKETLKQHGEKPSNVLWVGTRSVYFSWEDFARLADHEYSSSFGSQEVATDLLVVGDGWWLERYEYDGSENWVFKTMPQKPEKEANPKVLMASQIAEHSMWDDFETMQNKEIKE